MSNDEIVKYEATVITGLEDVAAQDCREKLDAEVTHDSGRVFIKTVKNLEDLLHLRCIDNLFVIIADMFVKDLPQDKVELRAVLLELMSQTDWKKGITIWQKAFGFDKSDVETILSTDPENADVKPKFRVTCNRTSSGKKHKFGSPEGASAFGGIVNDHFKWPVSMKEYDIEIVLNIKDNNFYVGVSLTTQSLHKRNLVSFGVTSLRPTVCYNMLRLAKLEPGDIVCDPMAGAGGIPLEAAIAFPNTFNIASDHHDKAIEHSVANFDAYQKKRGQIQLLQLDVTRLPFKDESIDVFVSDLPFGKRIGNRHINAELYPALLMEMARCSIPSKGRAVLLTLDKKNITYALKSDRINRLWGRGRTLFTKLGGLEAYVYCIYRTPNKYSDD